MPDKSPEVFETLLSTPFTVQTQTPVTMPSSKNRYIRTILFPIALAMFILLGMLVVGAALVYFDFHESVHHTSRVELPSSTLTSKTIHVSQVPVTTRGQPNFNFIVFGDWGVGQQSQKDVAMGMNTIASRVKMDGIISTGDQFYWNGIDNTSDPLLKKYYTDIYHPHAALKPLPWYLILGNHDWIKNPYAQIEYSKINDKWNLPAKWWTKEFRLDDNNEIQYIFLDTSPYSELERQRNPQVRGEDSKAQTQWFKGVLEAGKNRFKWRFVIGHHPFYSSGTYGDFGANNMTNIEKMLNEYKIDGYFNGHQHILQHLQTTHLGHRMNYYISGAGGQTVSNHIVNQNHPHSKFVIGKISGFMTQSITKDEHIVRVHDASGKVLHTHKETK